MKQGYTLATIVGLLIASYVLEAIVQPLTLGLATPYHYMDPAILSTYPFTTTVIVVRAFAIFLAPLWLMSFIDHKHGLKAVISFVLAGLTQLYVLQELALGTKILPLEWALAIALAGLAMLPTIVGYLIRGGLSTAHSKLTRGDEFEDDEDEEDDRGE